MEKIKNSFETNFYAQSSLNSLVLGFDDVAREKVRERLNGKPLTNSLSVEENELLMFILSQSILS